LKILKDFPQIVNEGTADTRLNTIFHTYMYKEFGSKGSNSWKEKNPADASWVKSVKRVRNKLLIITNIHSRTSGFILF